MGAAQASGIAVVNRSSEANNVIEFLRRGTGRLAVLYGRRGSRRRELIRNWVLPILREQGEAYYGDTDPDQPLRVDAGGSAMPVEEALNRGAVVFLGCLERYLTSPDKEGHNTIASLLARVGDGQLAGHLVLVLRERTLTQLLTFQTAAPSLMANMLEIGVVSFGEALGRLRASSEGTELRYGPEVLAARSTQTRNAWE